MKASRLVTTTILGAAFGVICMLATRYTADIDFWPLGIAFLLHHTVLGFAIGASSLKINWVIHGAFWGVLFGVFLGIVCIDVYPDPWMLFVMPVIWGFLIETLATKVFKQAQ